VTAQIAREFYADKTRSVNEICKTLGTTNDAVTACERSLEVKTLMQYPSFSYFDLKAVITNASLDEAYR